MALFLYSFVGMGYVILNSNEDAVFDFETELDLERKEWYIKHNPLMYGMEKSGFNITLAAKYSIS